jgi:hypothetical protein
MNDNNNNNTTTTTGEEFLSWVTLLTIILVVGSLVMHYVNNT